MKARINRANWAKENGRTGKRDLADETTSRFLVFAFWESYESSPGESANLVSPNGDFLLLRLQSQNAQAL